MAKLELLNVYVNDRLTAAAQDIFRAVRDLVLDFQSEVLRSKEENERLRRLLNAAVQRLLLQPELQCVQPPEVDLLCESEERLPRVKEEEEEEEEEAAAGGTSFTTDCSPEAGDQEEGNCSHSEPQRSHPSPDHHHHHHHHHHGTASPPQVKTEKDVEPPDDDLTPTACRNRTPRALAHILQAKNVRSLKAPPPPLHGAYAGTRTQRWHPCKECGKAFSFACQLEVHMRWHTKEKPYSCSVCRKSFTTLSMLKRHHRIHTGEKPFHCHVCGKRFNQSAHLNTHFRLHTRERLYRPPKT